MVKSSSVSPFMEDWQKHWYSFPAPISAINEKRSISRKLKVAWIVIIPGLRKHYVIEAKLWSETQLSGPVGRVKFRSLYISQFARFGRQGNQKVTYSNSLYIYHLTYRVLSRSQKQRVAVIIFYIFSWHFLDVVSDGSCDGFTKTLLEASANTLLMVNFTQYFCPAERTQHVNNLLPKNILLAIRKVTHVILWPGAL